MSKRDNNVGRPGEFRGDFTRDTFHAANQYSRVFMQQGRVSLDADWNEQISIINHYQRMLTTAVIGPHAAPWNRPDDFRLTLTDDNQYRLNSGYYYVNGLMCVNDNENHTGDPAELLKCDGDKFDSGFYIFYLDVWESHITYIDDDRIREQALGGADTATRAKINWKVRAKEIGDFGEIKSILHSDTAGNPTGIDQAGFLSLVREDIKPGEGRMLARGKPVSKDTDLCTSDSSVGYRGKENQLYRVEICRGGEDAVTFKWSRENSAVMFPIRDISKKTIILEHLGRDICTCLKVNDWVEVIAGSQDCHCEKSVLYQVVSIDEEKYTITLNDNVVGDFDNADLTKAYLRRWDHGDGDKNGIPLDKAVDDWYELEDGVEIHFAGMWHGAPIDQTSEQASFEERSRMNVAREKNDSKFDNDFPDGAKFKYQPGDYWLIPARSASNNIEWPTENGNPMPQLPHGVVHHYAPLRLVGHVGDIAIDIDTRRVIIQNWLPVLQRNATRPQSDLTNPVPDLSKKTAADTVATRKKKAVRKTRKKIGKKS